MKIASFNVENLFVRPAAFNQDTWEEGKPILDAYRSVNVEIAKPSYGASTKAKILELLLELDIYTRNGNGAIRRNHTQAPKWAWLRKNRGSFDREPSDPTQDVEIVAEGRDAWIGWIELATEPVDETGTRMTARVIQDLDADVIGIVEAEDRPSLVRFNRELLDGLYRHVMLVDGNDERGIDVGIMTKPGFEIGTIRSNVDAEDSTGIVFSRDCPQYQIVTPSGATLHVLVNHLKSQSGGGGDKRRRQATEIRRIVDELVADGQHVVVLGDFNEGPQSEGAHAENLAALFEDDSPLVECYALAGFELGGRPGTFDSCGLRNRLDYVFVSRSLVPRFRAGQVFRKGLWGTRQTRPEAWETYPQMDGSRESASDHAAVVIELDL